MSQDTSIDSGKPIQWYLGSEDGAWVPVLQFTNDTILENVEPGTVNGEMLQMLKHVPNSALGENLITWVMLC